jgi:rhodanese-related sulfurtransferase
MTWMSNLLPQDAAAPIEPTHGEHGSPPLPAHATLVDVRSTNEYMAGHLPGAINLPITQIEQEIVHRYPNRDTPLILYCASGARSEQALGMLQRLGYTDAHNGGSAVQLAQHLHERLQAGL